MKRVQFTVHCSALLFGLSPTRIVSPVLSTPSPSVSSASGSGLLVSILDKQGAAKIRLLPLREPLMVGMATPN